MLRRINTLGRGLSTRALAIGLALSLILPLTVVCMQTQAADADADHPPVYGKDLYVRDADANTMDSYAQATLGGFVYLNRNGGYSGVDGVTSPTVRNSFGSRFAGEVWADKSVFARYQPHIAEIKPFEEEKSYTAELTELDRLGTSISGVTAGKPLTAEQAEKMNNAVNALAEKYLDNFDPDNPTASGYKFQGDGDFDGRTLQLGRYTDGVNSSVAMNDDSDFLHVFSALGSSQVVDDNVSLPLDVVFVLDTSSTMAKSWGAPDELRLWKAGKALNDAFDAVLANKNNRVALVTYDTNANVALPLNRYTPLTNKDENERYFIVTDNKKDNAHRNITLNVKDIKGTLYTENYTVDSGTNTHQGLYEGMKMLAEEKTISSAVDTALGKMRLQRVPVVILMSDGEPSFVTTAKGELAFRGSENTEGVKTGDITDWWEPENPYHYSVTAPDREQLVGFPSGHSWGLALPLFLMAAHMKQEINKNYFKTDSPGDYPGVQVITVGIDPDAEGERSGGDWRRVDLMKTTLNPKDQLTEEYIADNIDNPKAGYAEYTEKLYEAVKRYLDPEDNLEELRLGVDEHNNWAVIKRPDPTDRVNPITWDGVRYNDRYLDVEADDLAGTLVDIITGLTFGGTVFNPVSGTNATGISNSITYEDPIGEYMVIDDVTDVTMFGEHYKVRKRAVYDYEANLAIRGENPLIDEGWYDSDNHYYGKDIPAGFTADNVWENGFTYRITYLTAQDYVPTLTGESSENELSDKQQNTIYTIYSITEQYARPGAASADNDEKWKIDKKETKKILEENTESRTRTNLSYSDEDAPDRVTFDLLEDIKIWVEDTGEYRDVGIGDFIVEEGYSEALFINISTKALPIQLASISCRMDNNVSIPVEYATNINDTWASTPLRVYYDVSFDKNYLRYQTGEYTEELNKEHAIGVDLTEISSEYRDKNTSAGFTEGKWQTAFYSGYFTDSTYNEYPVTVAAENISRGNAAVTFAASNDNRFYRFQKDRVLFLIPGVDESEVRPAEVDLGSETEVRKIGDPTTVDGLQAILNQARRDNHTYYSRYDCIPVTGAHDTRVRDRDGNELIIGDQISPDNWYYIIREYYVPITWDSDGHTKNVELRYRAIARKGSEFGSGLSKGGGMGSEVQWYNPNLPYGENTSPFKSNEEHWGRPDTQGDNHDHNADGWYVAARPGGLRVGGMENFVGTKGYDIREGADMVNFEKDPAVIKKANLTDTALSYFVPAISSYTGDDEENVAVNLYLGNNGRILADDGTRNLTNTVNNANGGQYDTGQSDESNYESGEGIPINPDILSDNTAGDVPKTGDDSQPGLWLTLLVLSMGGIVAVVFCYVKRIRVLRPKDKDRNH